MADTTTTTSTDVVLTPAMIGEVSTMLALGSEHKAALERISSEGKAGLSHSVTAAMAVLRDPASLDSTLEAAQRLVRETKAAKDTHNRFRVAIVAAVRAADPKIGPTAVATLMYGPTSKANSTAKTQIGRDFHNLEALAAVGAYNVAAKAKDPKAKGAMLTLPEAAKALRDKSKPEREAILRSLKTTGALPTVDAPLVRNVKGSTAISRVEAAVEALKRLDPEHYTTEQRTQILALLKTAESVVAKTAIVAAKADGATKTA